VGVKTNYDVCVVVGKEVKCKSTIVS